VTQLRVDNEHHFEMSTVTSRTNTGSELSAHFRALALRGSRRPQVGKMSVYVVVVCGNGCENLYLPKGIAKESEVADTRGSTATGAPL